MVGSAASPLKVHDQPAVDDGQPGVFSLGVYVGLLTREGVKVAHRLPFISEGNPVAWE